MTEPVDVPALLARYDSTERFVEPNEMLLKAAKVIAALEAELAQLDEAAFAKLTGGRDGE
jgi:hypothetical protein